MRNWSIREIKIRMSNNNKDFFETIACITNPSNPQPPALSGSTLSHTFSYTSPRFPS